MLDVQFHGELGNTSERLSCQPHVGLWACLPAPIYETYSLCEPIIFNLQSKVDVCLFLLPSQIHKET